MVESENKVYYMYFLMLLTSSECVCALHFRRLMTGGRASDRI